jgi:hypothetical protein
MQKQEKGMVQKCISPEVMESPCNILSKVGATVLENGEKSA